MAVPPVMARPAHGPSSPSWREYTIADDFDELVERAHDRAVERHRAAHRVAVVARRSLQLRGDVVDDHRVLLAVVLRVGEQERQQALLAEVVDGPEEAAHAERPGRDIWRGDAVADAVAPWRRPHADAGEGLGREADGAVALALLRRERGVSVVEEQQVFALHVEHERLRVDRLGAEHRQSGTVRTAGTWHRSSSSPLPRHRRC